MHWQFLLGKYVTIDVSQCIGNCIMARNIMFHQKVFLYLFLLCRCSGCFAGCEFFFLFRFCLCKWYRLCVLCAVYMCIQFWFFDGSAITYAQIKNKERSLHLTCYQIYSPFNLSGCCCRFFIILSPLKSHSIV